VELSAASAPGLDVNHHMSAAVSRPSLVEGRIERVIGDLRSCGSVLAFPAFSGIVRKIHLTIYVRSHVATEERPPVSLVNRRQVVIEWGHCDPAKMVHNNRYFEFADWSTSLLFEAAFGMGIVQIKAKYAADMPLVDARAQFIKPLTLSDVVDIDSQVHAFKRSSFVVVHRFSRDGVAVAEVQETRVWVGSDPGDPSKFKSKPIPAEVTERFGTA
jgi:4-hydroxybenzoyl-CoA thioesterase